MSLSEPRLATAVEIKTTNDLAEPIYEYLRELPGETALAVLVGLNALVMLNAATSVSKLEAWDHVSDSVRRTIEDNLKRGLQ